MPMVKLGRNCSYEIFRIMKEKGITQKDIADRIGVTQSAVSKKLKGMNLTMQEFQTVVKILQMDDIEILSIVRGKI